MRQRISDKNTFPVFSLEREYKKLHDLFFNRSEFGKLVGPIKSSRARPSLSYNDCLQSMFLNWELRGSFTSLEEMLFGLQISEDIFEKACTEERLLDYIQFILNAVVFVGQEVKSGRYTIYQAGNTICNAIVDNSHLLLDKLGAEMVNTPHELIIAYKDDVATAVSKQNPDMSTSIIEYLKIDNRFDLQKKGEVLCTLAKKLEPMESQFKGTEFGALCSDTTMLLNKIGARHAISEKDKISLKFISMENSELETWYDRTFQMIIACISVQPYIECKNEIKDIKSS